ncbi:hypothetical protein LCGC14_0971020, partial [marine sediment metagenome]
LYWALGNALIKMNAGRTAFTVVRAFPVDITDLLVGPNNNLLIYLGDDDEYWFMDTSEAFTETDVADSNIGVLWDSKAWQLKTDGSWAYSATPAVASPTWTAQTGITDIPDQIERLEVGRDGDGNPVIYASSNTWLKVFDFTNDVWINTEVKLYGNQHHGKGFVYWNNAHYLSYGLGVKQYTVGQTGTLSNVGLNRDGGIPAEYNGIISRMSNGGDHLFTLVDASLASSNSQSGIYAFNGRSWKCWWADPNNSNVLDFDGSSGLITVTDDAAIQNIFDGGGTIECWVNPDSDGEGDEGVIVDKSKWSFYLANEDTGKVKVALYCSFDGATNGTWITTSTEVDINTWTHIIVTYNSSATANDAIIYINGTVVAQTESATPAGTRETDVGSGLTIGNYSTDAFTFDGTIDEMRLYTRILGQSEVTSNYLKGRGGNPQPLSKTSLVGWWKMDEGTGATAGDSSGNDNDGTVTTANWAAGEDVYYMPLPAAYGNIENDTNRSFLTTGYFETSWLHGGFREDTKAFIRVDATLGHAFDSAVYYECHYQILGDTTWTDAGDLKGSATDRTATLFIPADSSSNNPVSTMIRFKFVGITDDTDDTPVLLNYQVRAIMYPTRKTVIYTQVRCANEITTKSKGRIDKGKYTLIKNALDNARTATWPVTITDIDDTTRYVKFLPLPKGTPRYVLVKDEKGRIQERLYNVIMQGVQLS